MSSALLVLLAATTSLLAVLIGRGSGSRGLGRAFGLTLELVGIAALFLAANLGLGVALVLAIRGFSPFFVSIYVLNDVTLVALSLLQGAVFFCWRRQP
jgi:hypothetical protein